YMLKTLGIGQIPGSYVKPNVFVRAVHTVFGSDVCGRELLQFRTDGLVLLQQRLALLAVFHMSLVFSRPLLLVELVNFLNTEMSVVQQSSIVKTILRP
ncbi:MAG TPA: hypothetical protein VI685_13770, partial [Candidatus Angelobacter sp.]